MHTCWVYDDPGELHAYARSYLGAGLAAGERAWFIGPDDPGGLPRGAEFVSLAAAYAGGAADPRAQVAAYAAATEAALAAGHTGLRVFADCTALVRTDAGLDAFARYEALIDRFIAVEPMRAVCALHRGETAPGAIGELACLHPSTNATEARFTLRGDPRAPGTALLAGELDGSADQVFPLALERVAAQPEDGQIVIDGRDLRFVDHRALLHLQRYAERRDATVVLHTALATAAHLVDLLRLDRVRTGAARGSTEAAE